MDKANGRVKARNCCWHPSPNFTARRGGGRPSLVVLHYTGMETVQAARGRLCDPAAQVSAHLLIGPDGRVEQLVDIRDRAWHAGQSRWGSVVDVNSWSIGIELANAGPLAELPPYPEAQMTALEAVLAEICGDWGIAPERVVGHSCIAPGRKIDPGPKLDWRRLALGGLAIWRTPPLTPGEGGADAGRFRVAARAFGFPVDDANGWTDALHEVWRSYALRFLVPSPIFAEGPTDAGVAHLEALATRWPVAAP